MEKPKRPLSSYNLFYRYKRAKILEAHANNGDDESTDTIHQLIMAVPGLENYPAIDGESALSSPELKVHRRHVIRSALLDNLVPTQTKRSHRKSHGAMNFLEMNKIMCASWKNIDDYSLSVFEELAEEGRGIYKERMVEYNEMSPQSQKKIITSVDMPTMMGIGMLGVETPPTSVPQDVASFHMKNKVVSSHQVMTGQMTSATTGSSPMPSLSTSPLRPTIRILTVPNVPYPRTTSSIASSGSRSSSLMTREIIQVKQSNN